MGTNCAPLVADLFLFCYERGFMLSLSDNNQTDILNKTSKPPVNITHFFNIANLLLNCLT